MIFFFRVKKNKFFFRKNLLVKIYPFHFFITKKETITFQTFVYKNKMCFLELGLFNIANVLKIEVNHILSR